MLRKILLLSSQVGLLTAVVVPQNCSNIAVVVVLPKKETFPPPFRDFCIDIISQVMTFLTSNSCPLFFAAT